MLFTKPAIPGRVKTRLIGAVVPGAPRTTPLDAAETARLHTAFLQDLVAQLASLEDTVLRVAWALDAAASEATIEGGMEALGLDAAQGFRQQGATLGERLFTGLNRVARDHRLVGAVGSDHPDLTRDLLDSGFVRLSTAEMVLGPAADGGYYFLGVRRSALVPRLFDDIPWSTGGVLEETLKRTRELSLSTGLLAVRHDVDTAEDLVTLVERIRAGATCPRTAELLTVLGLL